MGVHEEELMWLAERVRLLKTGNGRSVATTVQVEEQKVVAGELDAGLAQLPRGADGVHIGTDAGSEDQSGFCPRINSKVESTA